MRRFSSCIGTTTVTVKVYDADETLLYNDTLTVIVKKNATDATFTVENIADGDKFVVGQTVKVRLPRKGIDTDQRSLVSSDEKIATVKEQADSKRVYDVTFVKAGEVTLTAKAYQSAKYPKAIVEKAIKVTVTNPVAQSVKQVADNAIEITYASDIKDVITSASFKTDDIYYLIDNTKVPFSLISKVETDGNKAKITFHSAFVANTQYYVATADAEDISFVAAGHELKDVDSIKLTMTAAYKDEANTIQYAYYTASGLDITKSVVAAGYKPTFSITSDYAYQAVDDNGNEAIYFTEAGKTATIKITLLIGYDETTYAPIEKSDEIVITSSPKREKSFAGEAKVVITTKLTDEDKDSVVAKDNFAIGDKVTLQVFLRQKDEKTGNLSWEKSTTLGITKIECGDQNIAVVGAPTGNVYPITGINEGTTNIILYTTDSSTGKYVFFRSYPITVKAKRYAANVALTATKKKLNLNPLYLDSIDIYATVYDQYGEWFEQWNTLDNASIKMIQADGNAANTKVAFNYSSASPLVLGGGASSWTAAIGGKPSNGSFTINSGSFDISAASANTNQSIIFSLTEGTKSIKFNYSIDVMNVTATEDKFSRVLNVDKTSLDTGLISTQNNTNSNVATATLKLNREYSGFYCGTETFDIINERPDGTGKNASTMYGGAVATGSAVYLVYPEYNNSNGDFNTHKATGVTVNSNSIVLTNASTGKQLKDGNWKFTFYKYTMQTSGTPTINILGAQQISVTNNQKLPTVTVLKDKVASSNDADIKACFKFVFEGNIELNNVTVVPSESVVISQNGDVYVKFLRVTLPETHGFGAGKTLDITINKLLTK